MPFDPEPVKMCCACGRIYDRRAWNRLPLLGHAQGLEWRACPCTSTLTLRERPPWLALVTLACVVAAVLLAALAVR